MYKWEPCKKEIVIYTAHTYGQIYKISQQSTVLKDGIAWIQFFSFFQYKDEIEIKKNCANNKEAIILGIRFCVCIYTANWFKEVKI